MDVKKRTIELYEIRGLKEGWANISVDDCRKAGRLTISSDFGNWQYYWGSCGCEFKEFLKGLGIGYAADKFGEDRFFDIDESIQQNLRDVSTWEGDKPEEELKILESFLHSCSDYRDSREFQNRCYQEHGSFFVDGPNIAYKISPHFQRFWDEIWTPFVNSQF